MALVPAEQLTQPTADTSILLIGGSGCGKTASTATLHRVLRKRGLPTRMIYFDFDKDGAEPVLRLARAGYESIPDMIAKTNRIDPWTDDIVVYRYQAKKRVMVASAPAQAILPERQTNADLVMEFIRDFNTLDSRLDPQTGAWRKGAEVGVIIYDPLTQVQAMYEDFIWKTRNKELGEKGTNAIDWGDWGLLGEKVRDVYQLAKQFPCYFVCTAHLDQREEEVRTPQGGQKISTGQWFYTAALTKGLAMGIQRDFSLTMFATEDFKWLTKSSAHYRGARSRGRELPEKVDQDFANVLDV